MNYGIVKHTEKNLSPEKRDIILHHVTGGSGDVIEADPKSRPQALPGFATSCGFNGQAPVLYNFTLRTVGTTASAS